MACPSPTPTSAATSARRSIPGTSTPSRSIAAATAPISATAPMACSTSFRAPALRSTARRTRHHLRQLRPDRQPAQLRRSHRALRLVCRASTAIAATMACSRPSKQPVHDAENGYGGFASLIYNHDPHDQLRFVGQLRTDYYQIPYDPNPNDWENQLYDSSGLRDGEHETDGLTTFSWIHTFSPASLFEVSPFYHYNNADYQPGPNDLPTATRARQIGQYTGAQAYYSTSNRAKHVQGRPLRLRPARERSLRRRLQRRQRAELLRRPLSSQAASRKRSSKTISGPPPG